MVRSGSRSAFVLLILASCGGEPTSGTVPLEFRGELDVLGGFERDTGFVPEASPASIRVVTSANATFMATASATAQGDVLMPVAGSGTLTQELNLSLEVSARLVTGALDYEGVVDTVEYGGEATSTTFEPFLLGESVVLESPLPPAELATLPIPSVPGATLQISLTGGTVSTTYAGECAAVADGVAQYTATATVEGVVELSGSVEVDVPLVGVETFGPFPVDVPIPPLQTLVDLGSLSSETGMAAEGMPCAGGGHTATETDGAHTSAATGGSGTTGTSSDVESEAGDGSTSSGASTSGAPPVPEDDAVLCDDGLDNDRDGDVDCDDADCQRTAACPMTCSTDRDCGEFEVCANQVCSPLP